MLKRNLLNILVCNWILGYVNDNGCVNKQKHIFYIVSISPFTDEDMTTHD